MPKIQDTEITEEHVGRAVTYTGNRSHGGEDEFGVISSFNESTIFVRYGSVNFGTPTSPEDLEFQFQL